MKTILFIIMMAGAIIGLGELGYTKYFAGDKLMEGVLFDAANPEAGIEFDVSANDLPVRINLKAFGWLDYVHIQPIGQMEFSTGNDGAGELIREHFNIDEKNVISKSSVGAGNVRMNLKDYYLVAHNSILFETATPGKWTVKGTPITEDEFKFQSVEGTVFIGSKAINWYLAGPGLLFMFFGMIGFIAAVKADQ